MVEVVNTQEHIKKGHTLHKSGLSADIRSGIAQLMQLPMEQSVVFTAKNKMLTVRSVFYMIKKKTGLDISLHQVGANEYRIERKSAASEIPAN